MLSDLVFRFRFQYDDDNYILTCECTNYIVKLFICIYLTLSNYIFALDRVRMVSNLATPYSIQMQDRTCRICELIFCSHSVHVHHEIGTIHSHTGAHLAHSHLLYMIHISLQLGTTHAQNVVVSSSHDSTGDLASIYIYIYIWLFAFSFPFPFVTFFPIHVFFFYVLSDLVRLPIHIFLPIALALVCCVPDDVGSAAAALAAYFPLPFCLCPIPLSHFHYLVSSIVPSLLSFSFTWFVRFGSVPFSLFL